MSFSISYTANGKRAAEDRLAEFPSLPYDIAAFVMAGIRGMKLDGGAEAPISVTAYGHLAMPDNSPHTEAHINIVEAKNL